MDTTKLHIDTINHDIVGHYWSRENLLHTDPYSRLYFIVDGKGQIETRSRIWNLRKGYCYLIDSSNPFRHINSPNLEIYWIHFRFSVLEGMSLFNFLTCPVELKCSNQKFFQTMLDIYPAETLAKQVKLDGMLKMILAEFLNKAQNIQPVSGENFKRYNPVLKYINEHLDERISSAKLAKIMHMHTNYFSSAFSRQFGMSPQQYIIKNRIHKAQMLLWNTDLDLASISEKVGYEDHCYFCRIFHKKTGITPGQYRKQRPE